MHPYHYKEPNLLLEGIRCGSWSQALKAEHTKTYVSISTTSQMPQMVSYHHKEKFCSQKALDTTLGEIGVDGLY